MSRLLRAIALTLLVASCSGGGNTRAPRELDNACSIVNQHPDFMRAFRATERQYGVPIGTLMAMIYQESKFISDARPPYRYTLGVIPSGRQSSALGYSQALDGTWKEYKQITGRRGANRERITDATLFMGWYMQQSNKDLGIPMGDTRNQYLAYHDGRTGYKRGTWRSKSWLIRIAGELEGRAAMYDQQLRRCGKIR
ncbi:MAG: lytic transglycosylase [Paracoccaceae bacterium]|nr:lytic transglycosylase [Paracoccaceae bacterium]